MINTFSLSPIGFIRTPYKEKFAVPRQPSLVKRAVSQLYLDGESNTLESVRGLDDFTHIWVLFLFDKNVASGWKPTVRPPRLGGNERLGVFASRSPFRPNGIGMSAVPLHRIEHKNGQVILHLGNIDLVDNTPIIDIKPYVPYSDSIGTANGSYAQEEPSLIPVNWTDQANKMLASHVHDPIQLGYQRHVIEEVLSQDPRPAYKKKNQDLKEYAVHLFELNVKFNVINGQLHITNIEA
ncbi:tRNA (N6-threonylcarbamoyladenosine(37)-N6)-methyltransferase TrmO [Vibrio sp.]|nr:tRNA (N6-threonylcarbamoyladenosine(37)-N6)-methyltransferase TrmO [Vibrio sp.]